MKAVTTYGVNRGSATKVAPEAQSSPSRQPRANGHDTARRVSEALEAIQAQPDRGPDGRFVRGNIAAGKSMVRSAALWSSLGVAKRELVASVRVDLAADESAAETLSGLIDSYVEARLLRTSLFIRLSEMNGPVTAKGRVRALYAAYLSALDRERRLALDLGLQRRTKPLSLEQALAQAPVVGGEDG